MNKRNSDTPFDSIQWHIESCLISLNNYEKDLEKIKNNKYIYDNSYPKELVKPLYESKVKIFQKAIDYLKGLDNAKNYTRKITSEELSGYYKIVNS